MKRLGLVLLALGVLPYGVMQAWVIVQQLTWTPLRYPVSIHLGSITSPEFVTRATTSYDIFLEFDRRIDFQRMDCMLGLEYFDAATRCRGIPEAVNIAWQLSSDGHASATGVSGNYRMGAYSDTVSRQIGEFDAQRGQHHILRLDIKQDGGDLNLASPRLVVQVLSSYWEGTLILLQLSFFAAIVLGSIGLVIFVIGIIRVRRMRDIAAL